jgi:hypothetical protein
MKNVLTKMDVKKREEGPGKGGEWRRGQESE